MKFQSRWAAPALFVIALVMLSLSIEVQGATFTWNCSNDNWANTACWNPNGTPTSSDPVGVYAVSNTNTSLTLDSTSGTAYANSLTIDASAGTTVTLQQTAGALSTGQQLVSGGNEYVGYSGAGASTFIQTGGTNTLGFGGNLFVGYYSGSNGTYNLSNTGNLSGYYYGYYGYNEYVGYSGTGTFNQSGGTNGVGALYVSSSGSNGTYNLSNGNLTATQEYIYGTGTFSQSGGTNSPSWLYLSSDGTSTSTYNLNAGSLTASQEYVAYSGNGTFNQHGGTNTPGELYLGFNSGSNGIYNLIAGSLSASYVNIGYGGTGTFNQNGGSLSADTEHVGYGGAGTFNQNGGTNTLTGDLHIGDASYAGSSGTYNLNAGALSVGGNIAPINSPSSGGKSIGTLTIGNGTLTVGGGNGIINVGNLVLGSIAASNVNFTLSDAGLYQGANKVAGTLAAGNITVGGDGTATFTQNGTSVATGTITLAANAGSSGTYNLNGGTLRAANITVNSGGTFNFNGGTLSVGQFTGNLSNLGGTLAPGNSPGTTNITGDYSQSNAGTFAVEIGGTGPGEFDALHVSGTATLDGTLNVSLFDLGSGLFTPHQGDSFDILTADTLIGQFGTLDLAALGGGLSWNISYLTDAIGTTDVVRLTAVPLPAAFWLFGSGLLGLIGAATKRAHKRSL